MLGLTWGIMASLAGMRLLHEVGYGIFFDEKMREHEERLRGIAEYQHQMSNEMFEAMQEIGMIEELEEETVH